MSDQLASEILKLRTTQTTILLFVAAAALTVLGACVEGLSATVAELAREESQRNVFGADVSATFFATLAGLIAVTSEFRYGTIRATLLFEPRRRVVLAAKLATAALLGVAFAAVCAGVSFVAGSAIVVARDVDVALTGANALTLSFGTMAASALSAMIGVAVGTLIRNQVGAIVAVVAYAFAVDAILFAGIPSAGRFLPGKAGDALSGLPLDDLLSPGAGGATLLAWTLAFVAAAAVRNERTDV